MEFNYTYRGSSSVDSRADSTAVSFAPDTSRTPTFFSGELGAGVAFREAISALHEVVVSDLRFKPKDKTVYKAWAAQRAELDLVEALAQKSQLSEQIRAVGAELEELEKRRSLRGRTFAQARQAYFNYLYQKDRDAWFVLDPVITVHPDELFFECFSEDESTYGRLAVSYDIFRSIDQMACGTTNIDYSAALYGEFQKIRSYKTTRLAVDPGGFDVKTAGEDDYRQVKIDLPDSWVRGFLQVSAAMTLPAVSVTLHPMDVQSFCQVLRQRKEKLGPRSMRYVLTPGQPVKVVFEPWGITVTCARSIFEGREAREIRVWGRRRLLVLERLIPAAKSFQVLLLGQGMPSFYVADLGSLSFTLGLSGWVANDWSASGNFDLLGVRGEVDAATQERVFAGLKERWAEGVDSLAARLDLPRPVVISALEAYTQAGRVMYDVAKGLYRVRELSREPLPIERLRFKSEEEMFAWRVVSLGGVKVEADPREEGRVALTGTVTESYAVKSPSLLVDADLRIVGGACSCSWYSQNKLTRGPCKHMLALRLAYNRRFNPMSAFSPSQPHNQPHKG